MRYVHQVSGLWLNPTQRNVKIHQCDIILFAWTVVSPTKARKQFQRGE